MKPFYRGGGALALLTVFPQEALLFTLCQIAFVCCSDNPHTHTRTRTRPRTQDKLFLLAHADK